MPTILGGAAAEAGKGAALDVMKGFKEADFAGAGAAAGAAAAAALSSAMAARISTASFSVPAVTRGASAGVTAAGFRNPVPPVAGPPPQRQQMVQVHTDLHIDGRKVAKSTAYHMAEAARYPKHIGGMDTYGTWKPPGTTTTDAA